ncbi:MAG: hypothetical protein J6A88_03155 [Oscillospiraceae bacterium]|nr:hypothetical protein [Oscillospiraceae bacterium]
MKVIAVLLTISMLLCICGCKADPTDAAPTESTPTEVAPTETEPTETEPAETEPTEAEPTEAEPTEAEPTEAAPPPTTESSADPQTYVSQLLTDINYNGKIQPGTELVPPGTLPEISRIPSADQSAVGTTVWINLGAGQPKGSYLYRVDSQNNRELLAVVIHAAPEKTNKGFYIPMLAVFQVELGGLKGLCNAISTEESFSATILSLTNISFEEGMYTQVSATAADIPSEEVIDLFVGSDAAPNGWYIGSYGDNGSTVCYGGSKDTVSQQTSNDFAVFERIFTRFSIAF